VSHTLTSLHAEAIVAAAHELKHRRRLAGIGAASPIAKKAGKNNKAAKKVRCRIDLSKDEHRVIGKLRRQLAHKGIDASRDELIRASLRLLLNLDQTDFMAAIRDVLAPAEAPKIAA